MRKSMESFFSHNLSFKVVALLIALILWLTILGRRDLVISKDMEIEFQVSAQTQVVSASADKVRLKLSGSRNSLRRFVENGASQLVVVDLSQKGPGVHQVTIPSSKLDLPFGVRLLGLKPETLQVQIGKR